MPPTNQEKEQQPLPSPAALIENEGSGGTTTDGIGSWNFVVNNFTCCSWFIGRHQNTSCKLPLHFNSWSAVLKVVMAQIPQGAVTGKSGPVVRGSLEEDEDWEDEDPDGEIKTDFGKDETALCGSISCSLSFSAPV